MTFTSSGRSRVSAGNGVVTSFSTPPYQAGGLYVYLLAAADDAAAAAMGPADGTLLTEGVDYTVAGDGEAGSAVVTTVATYAAGQYVLRWRQTSLDQVAEYLSGVPFPSAATQSTLDRAAMALEEIADDRARLAARAIQVPAGTIAPALDLSLFAGKAITVNAGGSAFVPLVLDGDGGVSALVSLAALGGADLVGTAAGDSVQDALDGIGIRPESFGAAGDGATNDASAFQQAIDAAKTLKCPILLDGTKTYAVGATGWAGLAVTAGHIDLRGNGATIKVLVRPSQNIFVGSDRALFRLTDTDGQRWRDLRIDLNNLDTAAIVSNGGDDIAVTGCECYGSSGGTSRTFFMAMGGTGFYARGNYCHGIDYAFRTGHTTAGYEYDQVRIVANRAETLNGDFHVCVGADIWAAFNKIDGCFAGWAISGYDDQATTCANVTIAYNTIRNFTAQGVQIDIVRTAAADVRMSGIAVQNNCFSTATSTAYCAYIYGTDGFDVSGNWTDAGIQRGVSVFDATNGQIYRNNFGIEAVVGISLDPSQGAGDITNVVIEGNILGVTATGIIVQADGTYKANKLSISRNTIIGGTAGLAVLGTGHVGLTIAHNRVTGQSGGGYSVRCETQDADIHENAYDGNDGGNFGVWTLGAPAAGVVSGAGRRLFKAAYGGATSISSFSGVTVNKPFDVWASNANLTLTNGTLMLNGGVDAAFPSGGVMRLVKLPDASIHELSRNF